MAKFTSGERRGMIALLIILALVIGVLALKRSSRLSVARHSETEPQERVIADTTAARTATPSKVSLDSLQRSSSRTPDREPKELDGTSGKSGGKSSKKSSKSSSSQPSGASHSRSPLDELNN